MAYEEMDEQERENLELKTRLQAYEEVEEIEPINIKIDFFTTIEEEE